MEENFNQLNNECGQNTVDKQCAEIEKKNLLIENENLIVNCLSIKLMYDVEKYVLSRSWNDEHGRTGHALVSGLRTAHNHMTGNRFIAHEFCGKVHGVGHLVSDLEVAFRKHTCFVRDIKGTYILKGCPQKNSQIHSTDKETKLSNQVMSEYYEGVGIFHQTSVPRTPQQNGVVERRNRTLVEAARTMMIFSKAPMFYWAESFVPPGQSLSTTNCSKMHPSTSASSSNIDIHLPVQHQKLQKNPFKKIPQSSRCSFLLQHKPVTWRSSSAHISSGMLRCTEPNQRQLPQDHSEMEPNRSASG
ncbi:retrovirus-related pol polyprotein from transposon TNT 1-94 [Tanacetum coccineum]